MTATLALGRRASSIAATTQRVASQPRLVAATVLLVVVVVAAVAGPIVLTPHDPNTQHLTDRLAPPSGIFPLGTDELGRDLFSRILSGLRPALLAGLLAVSIAAVVGTITGIVTGYLGGWLDAVVMRVMDVLLAWPTIFLALGIVLVIGPGRANVIVAVAVAEIPVFTRLVRSVTLSTLRAEHVTAARSMGASNARLMRRHILPFAVAPLIVQFAIAAPQAVVAEASLSFLGLGTQPPDPSLGGMISSAQDYLALTPGYAVYPAITLGLVVLALTLFADGMQNLLDPRYRVLRS